MEIEVDRSNGAQRLVVSGEVDADNRTELLDAGKRAVEEGDLAVDLGGVSFIDSSGIGALVELLHAAGENENDFSVVAVSSAVRRVLEIAGLTSHFGLPEQSGEQ